MRLIEWNAEASDERGAQMLAVKLLYRNAEYASLDHPLALFDSLREVQLQQSNGGPANAGATYDQKTPEFEVLDPTVTPGMKQPYHIARLGID